MLLAVGVTHQRVGVLVSPGAFASLTHPTQNLFTGHTKNPAEAGFLLLT